jgi:hypothetical protein
MKSRFTTVFATLTLLLATAAAFGQALSNPKYPANANGRVMADEFGRWQLQSQSGISSGAQTVTLNGCYVKVGTAYEEVFPIGINTPLLITDGANTETVTPTAVTQPTLVTGPSTISPYSCSFTATFANSHLNAGFSISAEDNGLEAAINYALAKGIGTVTIEQSSYITNTMLSTAQVYPQIQIEDLRSTSANSGNGLLYWNPQPSTLTALTVPIPRVGSTSNCTGTNTVCDTSTTVASGGFTNAAQYVWVAYVDPLGGVSEASTTAHYTTAGSVVIEFVAPAAQTGAVGWVFGIGTSYAAAYWIPATSSICTLTTIETVVPACALANTAYNQTASNAFVSKPATTFALYPFPGGVAGAYNPNFQSHTTFAYAPSPRPYAGFEQNYGPFTVAPALTAGQAVVLGTVALPPGYLNYIPSTLHITGNITLTPSTGGTIQLLTGIGDITDFTTGTPKAVCTDTETTATGTAAIKVHIDCTWTVNGTGTTGSIMPGGFMLEQLQAGTTTGNLAVESATAAVTTDVLDQDLIYVEFLQTTAAESTNPPQLIDLHIEVL